MNGFWHIGLALALLGTLACGSGAQDSDDPGDDGEGGEGGDGGAPPATDCDPPADPQPFAIGTGELCFEPLADGQVIPMLNGPQGGYHAWLALGCADCGSFAVVRYQLLDPVTLELIPRTYEMNEAGASLVGDVWPQAAGLQIGLPGTEWDPEEDPPLEVGTDMLLAVEVFDASGQELLHEASVTVQLGAIQPWDPCVANPDGPCCADDCL